MSEGVAVRLFDGVGAVRRAPLLVAGPAGFTLVEDGREEGPFAFAELIGRGHHDGHAQFALKARPGWRLDVPLPVPDHLVARLPGEERYGRWIDRVGLWAGVAVCAVVAAGVVFAIAQTPTLAARLVPRSVERQLGDALVGDFGNRTCDAPAGEGALRRMVARLGPGAADAQVRVVNVPMVNAVALPGGHVLVFRGLLSAAETPDEVAGVIAHELGHVAHRDVLAALIRQMGLSVVLGGLGGDVGGWANTALALGYTRGAEGAADRYAIDVLKGGGISARGTADFFARMARRELGSARARRVATYLSSHPLSDDRRARFRAVADAQTRTTPALNDADWAALKRICRDDPDVSATQFAF